MSTCNHNQELLPESWVAARLDPEAAAAFEEHLMTCEDCQQAVLAARGLRRGLQLVAAERAARPNAAPSPRRWLALAALVPLALGAFLLVNEQRRLAASRLEVARLEAAVGEARQANEQEQQKRSAAEAARSELERQLAEKRSEPARLAPLVDLPTFLLATLRDAPKGPDLVLERRRLGQAFNLALDLPDPAYNRFRVEIQSGGKTLLAREGLEAGALDALLLTLPADFLPDGESKLELYGQGPGRPEQQLAAFRIRVAP